METLGEYLREVRTSLGFSVADVAAKTGIQLKFIDQLEEGKLAALPPEVYVQGFLRQLGALYGISADTLHEQYKKELAIATQLGKRSKLEEVVRNSFLGRFVVTPKAVSISAGTAFVVITLVYIVWQILSINKTPSLTIDQPTQNQIVKDSAVAVSGKTDPGMSLTINDESVFVDTSGNFQTQVGVNNGPKNLVFVAKNKFGKTASQTISIIGQTPSSSDTGPAQVILKLDFTGNVSLTYSIDGQDKQVLSFIAGDSKTFTAQKSIVISTSNAGATKATYNGQVLGFLGKTVDPLNNLSFSAQIPSP